MRIGCSSLDVMKGFPIEKLMENQEKCLLHFYRRGALIVKDSVDSEWLYIIKSGQSPNFLTDISWNYAQTLYNGSPDKWIRVKITLWLLKIHFSFLPPSLFQSDTNWVYYLAISPSHTSSTISNNSSLCTKRVATISLFLMVELRARDALVDAGSNSN